MFPVLLGHPHAYEPFEDTPADTGDFDKTPPQSSRPSLSLASGEERRLCIADIKAATAHSRVPGPAGKSSQSITSREPWATHQKSRAVRNTIAKLVPTTVSRLGTENQSITIQDKVKSRLRRPPGPGVGKGRRSEVPELLTSSYLLRS